MPRNRHAMNEQSDTQAAPTAEGANVDAATEAAAEGVADDTLRALQNEVEEWMNKYLYSVAEMDNVRRRARLDADEARKFANERLMGELLPVLDNFTRALEAAGQAGEGEGLKQGVEMIHRQLSDVLARAGLERIEAVGRAFDPNLHEAIMQVEAQEGQEPHQVVEDLRSGYRLNDRVLRPSLVKVTAG